MGKGRDKRRKQKGSSTAGLGAAKTLRKTEKNERKTERRIDRRLERDEEDVDALLEKFRLEDELKTQTVVQNDCEPPSVRVHASYTPLPLDVAPLSSPGLLIVSSQVHRDGLVMVFGGEYEDQEQHRVFTYNDLYRFNCEKQKWTKIIAPNSPAPRSAHQAVYYKRGLYVFGGEFTSPKQDRFKHFKDLWRFDLEANSWELYDIKRGPTGRSGHRTAVYKNKMILFGGFNDSGDSAVYYNDLWVFEFDELRWTEIDCSSLRPSRRGGCRIVVYGDALYLYGGYSRHRDEEEEDVEHGVTLDDMWKLDLKHYEWERIKKAGMDPGGRSGFNMCLHQHRAVFFGGATDNEARKGESIVSDFHNDLYQFNFERQRWYTINLRPPRQTKRGKLPDFAAAEALAEAEEHHRRHEAAVKIQSRYRGYAVRKAYKVYKIGGKISELLYSPATYGFDLTALNAPKPRGRISAGLCVVKHQLWLFGGVVEIMEREITLDDIWRLSLKNYDGWHCVQQNTVGEEAFREDMEMDTSSSDSAEGSEMDTDSS